MQNFIKKNMNSTYELTLKEDQKWRWKTLEDKKLKRTFRGIKTKN